MIHIHETNLLCMHHILKKKDFNQTLNSFFGNFEICNFIKRKIFRKIFIFVFNENTDMFCNQKNSNLYY